MLNLNLNWVSETIKTIKDWWPVVKSNFQQIQNNYNSHISGTSDKHLAEHITYSGVVSGASNVKQGIDNIKNSYNGHVNGESDKHAAEHITFSSNRPTLPDSDVKGAIETVDSRIEQIIQGQSIDPNKDVEVLASRTSSIYGEFPTLTERLDNADTIINDINAKIDAPDYSAPQEVTDSVITLPDDVVEGQFSDIVVKGNIFKQIIENGNFANGTTRWVIYDATASVANNVLTLTGKGTQPIIQLLQTDVPYAKKIYVRAKIKTPPECTGIRFRTWNGVSEKYLTFTPISSGVFNSYYAILEQTEVGTQFWIEIDFYFVNAAAANGKIMEVQEVMAIDMGTSASDNPLYNLTPEEMNQRFPYWLPYGMVSTESVRVKSVGKNLFDGVLESGTIDASGLNSVDATKIRSKNYIKIKPSTSYIFSNNKGYTALTISYYDANKAFISQYAVNYATFTTPSNAVYARFQTTGTDTSASIQLELGTTATAYEPYTETSAYTPSDIVLRSLPNGTKDEFNVTTGEKTQRVSDDFIINENTQFGLFTTSEQTVRIEISSLNPKATNGWYSPNILINNRNMPAVSGYTAYNTDSEGMGIDVSGSYLYIRILKSRLSTVDIAGVKAWLASNSITVNYQLASPAQQEGTGQSLIAYPGGHLIIECVKKVTKSYDSGITVDKPIESIESVTKVEDGERIPIDLSKITVAGNKLSFTITGAVKNEIYEVIYHYNGVLPTVRFSYTQNVAAAIDGNTKGVAANSKAINDFISYQNAINLQFDLRLVALEP